MRHVVVGHCYVIDLVNDARIDVVVGFFCIGLNKYTIGIIKVFCIDTWC